MLLHVAAAAEEPLAVDGRAGGGRVGVSPPPLRGSRRRFALPGRELTHLRLAHRVAEQRRSRAIVVRASRLDHHDGRGGSLGDHLSLELRGEVIIVVA